MRKTTKWAVTANEELRRILIDCEEWSKMARHGGIDSDLLDADRKGANENIKISGISQVSASFNLAKVTTNLTCYVLYSNWTKSPSKTQTRGCGVSL